METITAKRAGRKPKHFIASDGTQIKGLSRRPDGRWRIIGTQLTFREPDEYLAISRFRQWERQQNRRAVFVSVARAPHLHDVAVEADKIAGETDLLEILHENGDSEVGYHIDLVALWKYVAAEINKRPKWVAEQTGLEQIGYLTDLRPPAVLPSLASIGTNWTQHCTTKRGQKRKVFRAWEDFCATTKVNGLDDITADVVVAYKDRVHARNQKGKTQQHLFTSIRRILRFAADRAIAPEVISRVLAYLTILKPSKTTVSIDPHPIERDDFRRLLDKATGDMRAMLLLCINAALHPQELVDVEWSEIRDGCMIAHREKRGRMLRIAVLWPETLEALNAVKRRGDKIFISDRGAPLTVSGAGKRFRKLREAAKVSDEVKFDDLRDGAATSALEANVNNDLSALLLGHRSGIKDHYAKRRPKIVAPACQAIYDFYMTAKPSLAIVAA